MRRARLAVRSTPSPFVDLGYACAAGAAIDAGAGWRQAHALVAAAPSAEWPAGLPVLTVAPRSTRCEACATIPLT